MLPDGWTVQKIGDVLSRVVEPVMINKNETYQEIGIRSHGKGIFHKEPVLGASLGEKRVFWVQPNCFIVNIVFAWEQAIARTTESENGKIASHRFPMYRPIRETCNVDFLTFYFRTPTGKYLLGLASPGGAGRNKTLGQKEFEKLKICMPDGAEQKKIARILSTWDRAIETVERLIANSKAQKKALMQQLLTGKQRFPGFEGEWREVRLSDVAAINPKRPAQPLDGRITFLPMEAVSDEAQILRKYDGSYYAYSKGYTAFQDGDVLVAKITPCFENGKGCFAQGLENGVGFGSTEFHVLRARRGTSSRFLFHLINSREFRFRGEANMQGSAGQRRVPTDFLIIYRLKIPLTLLEQDRISGTLDRLDDVISYQRKRLEAFKNEKKALMQQLLTGKRRVTVDEEAA